MPRSAALAYRPDIDGLRAVAVSSVVAYHAFPQFVPGGFVGVDIFFVISGYLISTILIREMQARTFSLWGFYARRIRRLFPALIIVLGATLLAGWFYLLPHEFVALGKHTSAGAAYVINIVLSRESGYFDAAAETKPLLHLWSLAVEEQFYLVWPVAMLALIRWNYTVTGIAAVTLASFAMNVASADGSESAAFFLSQNRIWELSIGALLAALKVWPIQGSTTSGSEPSHLARAGLWPHLASLAGFGLVATAILGFDDGIAYPGAAALLPCLGAALIIAAGANGVVNRRLMALRPVVFLGLISYPLYLWHWPLLSIPTVLGVGNRPAVTLAAVGLAIAAAIGTYLLVEKPLRHRPSSALAIVLLAGTAMLGVAGVATMRAELPPRLNAPPFQEVGLAIDDWTYPVGLTKSDEGGLIRGTPGSGQQGILFIGDSHMEQYWPRVAFLLEQHKSRKLVRFATRGGCLPIPGAATKSRGRNDPDCAKLADQAMADALSAEIESVVIAASWRSYIGRAAPEEQEKIYSALGTMFRELRNRDKTVWLVLQLPGGSSLSPTASVRRWLDGSVIIRAPSLQRGPFEASWAPLSRRLVDIAKAEGVGIINPMDGLCNHDVCRGQLSDGTLMYKDAGHLRASVAALHATFIDRVFDFPPEHTSKATGSLSDVRRH